MPAKPNAEFTNDLFKAILTLETVEECEAFFKDLCTIPELKALSQRFAVAMMLDKNMVYNKIVEATGASTATISRVKRSLDYENAGGYTLVFERLKEEESKGERRVGANAQEFGAASCRVSGDKRQKRRAAVAGRGSRCWKNSGSAAVVGSV